MRESEEAEGQRRRALALIDAGAKYGGPASGAAIGLIGGPLGAIGGAIAGAALSEALQKVGSRLEQRVLDPSQHARVGLAYATMSERIAVRLAADEEPRQDGFFQADDKQRASAEELLEGVLLAAADSYEEGKVPFLGNLYAAIAFDDQIDRQTANYLIKTARQLTFRQLAAMAVLWDGDAAPLVEAGAEKDPVEVLNPGDALGLELDDLERQGIVGRGEPGGTYRRGGATFTDVSSLPFGSITLTDHGHDLYELLGLQEMEPDARHAVLDALTVRTPSI